MDIGSNLGDTIQYQTVHEELISKLKVKNVLIFFHCTYHQYYLGETRSYYRTVDTCR
jgi:hypothetical protein